jgi:aminoglycoside phosphotransferase (APT) family kinase protein
MTSNADTLTLEARQARELARTVVVHHFGSKPRRLIYKSSGLTNFVFLVKHAEGNFVVRISPEAAKINAFIKEQWAQSKAAEAGVPTTEILEVGNEIIAQPYMISKEVKGREATYNPNRLDILQDFGRYAALINSIPTNGFGGTFDWSNNQLSLNETWTDYLQKELQFESKLRILEKRRMLTAPQIKELRAIFADTEDWKPKPVLNHGDLRLKNAMVDEQGKITAILDWEKCISNPAPHWELSHALHDLSIDEKQEFLKGYGLSEKKIIEMAPLMKALNIINYAPVIEHLAEVNDSALFEQYRTRLSGALDFYSLSPKMKNSAAH